MTQFTTPRGMEDIGVEEMERRLWIQSKIEPVIRSYGFRRVEPTFIEHLDTLKAKSGESILQEIYYFKDKAGRDLGLRFDLTVGMARMVANDPKTPEPIKLYAISPMWRYDEPQAGRYRCFWQWDVETYGPTEPYADAEVIALGLDVMSSVGLNASAHISHRKLIEGVVRTLGAKTDEQVKRAFNALDKAQKISRDELNQLLQIAGLTQESSQFLLDLVYSRVDLDSLKTRLDQAVLREVGGSLKELDVLWDELGSLGIKQRCSLDLSIVRGLDYYDGIVFEGYTEGSNLALFGGGRYNNLTAIYGPRRLPATGVAGGIERLMLALERAGVFSQLEEHRPIRVFVANTDNQTRRRALSIVDTLRKKGVVAEYAIKDWNLRRQLSYANARGYTHVIIVGSKEVSTGVYTLKELKSGLQVEKSLQEILEALTPP
ncbi:MAG: histidine--tRNA ligase [Thermoprotei archaeon]